MRVPVPFPCLAFVDREGRTPDRGFRIALVRAKFHANVLTGEDIAGKKVTDVAVERADFPAVPAARSDGPRGPTRCASPSAHRELLQQGRNLREREPELFVENHHQHDHLSTELCSGGADRVGRLQRMTTLDASTAPCAPAHV
jgi:hypothetical protein